MNTSKTTHHISVAYLLWILGFMGAHRFYMGKIGTGILYLMTFGLFGLGILYDYFTLNRAVDELNRGLPRT